MQSQRKGTVPVVLHVADEWGHRPYKLQGAQLWIVGCRAGNHHVVGGFVTVTCASL
jgi:hypothetical protein